jgi:2-keto-4-pentenoate hydratase
MRCFCLILAGLISLGCASAATDAAVGYKLGFTSAAARQRFGVETPVWGRLRATMQVQPDGEISAARFSRVFVEAEVAFTMGRRLDVPLEDPADLLAYVETVHPALELPDWRFPAGVEPGVAAILADGVGAHRFVLGPGRDPREVALEKAAVILERDGEVMGRGRTSDALGSPWRALLWLSHVLLEEGRALEPGEVVLTGALGPVQALAPESAAGRYRARVEGLGSVAVTITTVP